MEKEKIRDEKEQKVERTDNIKPKTECNITAEIMSEMACIR